VNLMITMLLGGLWHGASWNFVIWGALHGGGLAVTRMWQRRFPEHGETLAGRALATFLTFQLVCFAWIFFRAPTLAHALLVIERIGRHTLGAPNLSPRLLGVLAIGFLIHLIPRDWDARVRGWFVAMPAPAMGVVLALAAYGLHVAAGAKAEPFVYGQF
jgi:hypothetical protein